MMLNKEIDYLQMLVNGGGLPEMGMGWLIRIPEAGKRCLSLGKGRSRGYTFPKGEGEGRRGRRGESKGDKSRVRQGKTER